jgi:hypothetical protein
MLFVVTIALWARGIWRGDVISWQTDVMVNRVYFNHGYIIFWADDISSVSSWWTSFDSQKEAITLESVCQELQGPFRVQMLGFAYGRFSTGSMGVRNIVVIVPFWFVVFILSIYPLSSCLFSYYIQRRRSRKGLCRYCGYDLRASPNCCPECGMEVIKNQTPEMGNCTHERKDKVVVNPGGSRKP